MVINHLLTGMILQVASNYPIGIPLRSSQGSMCGTRKVDGNKPSVGTHGSGFYESASLAHFQAAHYSTRSNSSGAFFLGYLHKLGIPCNAMKRVNNFQRGYSLQMRKKHQVFGPTIVGISVNTLRPPFPDFFRRIKNKNASLKHFVGSSKLWGFGG